MITAAQNRLLHVARRQLGLSEEVYRDLLARFGGGAASAKDLNREQFGELMDYLGTCGFKSKAAVPGAPNLNRQPQEKRPYLNLIWQLLKKQQLPWKYADGVAWRMFQITRTVWCSPEQLRKVAAALEYRDRQEEKHEMPD
jgi:phage gp16-like protein